MNCPLQRLCHAALLKQHNEQIHRLNQELFDNMTLLANANLSKVEFEQTVRLLEMEIGTYKSVMKTHVSEPGRRLISRYRPIVESHEPKCVTCTNMVEDDSSGRVQGRCWEYKHRVNRTKGGCPNHTSLTKEKAA
ncbi:hypothetical protein PDESU_03298 [Pontiella desulfatans]|uniref:Uncharacterized protein n=1 Tax=Pontiella desulfatans TaxID=2750659 RepID=A0A6C2U4G9_PONDE|nr:hypothetical protein [Pontiella desulfatans]VGO14729.1 hypothetical protein PDESU_03298 [Pontiella desulfatans]